MNFKQNVNKILTENLKLEKIIIHSNLSGREVYN